MCDENDIVPSVTDAEAEGDVEAETTHIYLIKLFTCICIEYSVQN